MVQRSQARAPASPLQLISSRFPAVKDIQLLAPLRFGYRMLVGVERYLKAKGVIVRPLVPEKELSECQRKAITTLMTRDPKHEWGDYLEFGVFQGHSMSLMYRNLAELNLLPAVRLYGFDSFEGYPAEAREETFNGYMPGQDKAETHVAQRVLSKRGVDWQQVKLIKGWFSDSLTPEFREREKIKRVSLVNFDCDLYLSTAQALTFTAPLLQKAAIFFFDDWGTDEMINQKKAFVEFLEANPDVYAEELPNYSSESRVFYVARGAGALLPWQDRVKALA